MTEELRQKGIAFNIIETVLADYDEFAAAQTVAYEQARRLKHLPPKVLRRRLVERLARRGFSYDIIQDILAADAFSYLNHQESEEIENG